MATLCAARRHGEDVTALDIFRLQHGRIVEHWHETEPTAGTV